MKKLLFIGLAILFITFIIIFSSVEKRLVFKSARQTSTYYAFAVGIANSIMAGAHDINITVETSPGNRWQAASGYR